MPNCTSVFCIRSSEPCHRGALLGKSATAIETAMNDEATYVCGACGEEIVVPIDVSQGERQEYVEDCPVCCRANIIRVEVDEQGEVSVWSELE